MNKVDPKAVAYYFYRPIVRQHICSMNKVHNQQIGVEYYARLRDGSEREVTKDEYDARPR